ncbi:thioredoxin family protein [Flavobacterium jejuense]|uniref:Thioredoxin family protein n=1 Tax=Flavobacterium jejuense TaxID=1544455 RepID=A0ABX0IS99_9FLAO|nr:thioredoxin family protein [Flavobacterium jejuense]NHN26436.1 thioredoxin family protein [Flavobacterium jejuense]
MKKFSIIGILALLISCSSHTKGEDGKSGEPGKEGVNGKNGEDGKDGNLTIGFNFTKKKQQKEITDGILVGLTKKSDLQQDPFRDWFESGYNSYQPNKETINDIKKLPLDYSITIFMGTWCEDSQNQIPKFYKILNEINFPEKKINLITMKRDKTTPELFEKDLDITNVPTFIFYKDGKEINRIVESPIGNLELDMLTILSKKPYKNIYAE